MFNNQESESTKFIDILLVVMGLVLAGGLSEVDNTKYTPLFYYGIFVFLASAITLRAFLILAENTNKNSSWYTIPCIILCFLIALSFPFVFASYFYSKLNLGEGNTSIYWSFVVFEFVISIIMAMALGKSLKGSSR